MASIAGFIKKRHYCISPYVPNYHIMPSTCPIDTLINLNVDIYVVKRFDHPHSTTRNLGPVWHEG